jgi:hypothetical protein
MEDDFRNIKKNIQTEKALTAFTLLKENMKVYRDVLNQENLTITSNMKVFVLEDDNIGLEVRGKLIYISNGEGHLLNANYFNPEIEFKKQITTIVSIVNIANITAEKDIFMESSKDVQLLRTAMEEMQINMDGTYTPANNSKEESPFMEREM